ncbi:FAD-binding domain-containing protein [Rhodoferax sp.]|uniref:FAD-binding domain-containing protein n=1 Tax=Rhodoferax sp. TaxID=50421 RepID=UPI0025F98A3E|nr:FAD-binding domain-containing protein [Rhodoferax sp.]
MSFEPTLAAAQARLKAVRPAEYARSRNAIEGAVTGLSPYITHGLVTLPEVLADVAAQHRLDIGHKLVFELGWREYFRHVWQHQGNGILQSLHEGLLPKSAYAPEMPADILQARTGIPAIDTAVRTLYATGYLHNHARMWLASYIVHIRKVHWCAGADWMIAHLLDGDLASNHLSWQWVAGTGSTKPYLFNAENVAKYSPPDWHSPGSAIDTSYAALDAIAHSPRAIAGLPGTEGLVEPAVSPTPPDVTAPDAALVAGRDVWLVHPWALRLPPDLPAQTLCIGIYLEGFHSTWPWSRLRWSFVGARMAELTTARWHADTATLHQALRGARSVRTVADAHVDLSAFAQVEPAPLLFAEVARPCTSFSQWWTRTARGITQLHDLPGLAGLSAGPLFDHPLESTPHDNDNPPDRPGDRRTRWHRP